MAGKAFLCFSINVSGLVARTGSPTCQEKTRSGDVSRTDTQDQDKLEAVTVSFWQVTPALPNWIYGDFCILLHRSSQLCKVGWGHSQVSRDVCLGSLSVVTETTTNVHCVFRVIVL